MRKTHDPGHPGGVDLTHRAERFEPHGLITAHEETPTSGRQGPEAMPPGAGDPATNLSDEEAAPTSHHAWVLDVQGMFCERCNIKVTDALNGLDGVAKVVVDDARTTSTPVLVRLTRPSPRDELFLAVESAGFVCSPAPDEGGEAGADTKP